MEALCLSGTEYAVRADVAGNVVIRNLKGNGRIELNVRESGGATALQNELRIVGDRDVRACMQIQIARILDAIFESTPAASMSSQVRSNDSIRNAKFIGYLPGQLEVLGLVEHGKSRFFRFQVKDPANFVLTVTNNSKQIRFSIVTHSKNQIASGTFNPVGRTSDPFFLVPGEYVLQAKMEYSDSASAFKVRLSPD